MVLIILLADDKHITENRVLYYITASDLLLLIKDKSIIDIISREGSYKCFDSLF